MTERDLIKTRILTDTLFATSYFFKKRYSRRFVIGEHHKKIAEALNRVLRGETKRLIINIPPRYGKTEIAVKNFVSAGIALNPESLFIILSYSDDLALDNSEDIKDLVQETFYKELFPYVEIKKDSRSKKKWYTTQGGGVYATSTRGQITGFGAGIFNDDEEKELEDALNELEIKNSEQREYLFGGALIIDDPQKPEDAQSTLERDKVNLRFETTIRSRLNSRNTPIIIIMQRLHPNDLCGYLMELEPEDWEVLSLPAITIDEDGSERALWEFKQTLAELKKIERAQKYVFRGQYMQDPVDLSGEKLWLFSFNKDKHTGAVEWNAEETTYLSFDFNRNPLVCSVWQHYDGVIRGIEVIEIENATIKSMCVEIESKYKGAIFMVTGDVSGKTLTTVSNLDNFQIIKNHFNLSRNQMQYSGSNPRLSDSRYFVNSIFEEYPIILDKEKCSPLIFDCENVKSGVDNTIIKETRKKAEQRADSLDTMRYFLHRFCKDVLFFTN